MSEEESLGMVDEVEAAIKEAAAGQKVVQIRLAVGKEVTVSRVELAAELHKRFPEASITLLESKITDSIVVKDIEVE
jgi:hypothetical protein